MDNQSWEDIVASGPDAQRDPEKTGMDKAGPFASARLLRDLELASAERNTSVAVLSVEPDRDKQQVRVLAEARNLSMALAYVERLQKSEALRFPMLESHAIQEKDPQRPVRFQLRADWSIP